MRARWAQGRHEVSKLRITGERVRFSILRAGTKGEGVWETA